LEFEENDMTIGSFVIISLAIILALCGYYYTALSIALAVAAVNAGCFYVLLMFSEEAQKHPERYDTSTMHSVQGLYYYSSGWMTLLGLLALGIIVWFAVFDRERKELEKALNAPKAETPTKTHTDSEPRYD
jgi:mannose/fructose/N-acetylgalactosamine-specific phosphotransferase system component IIC